MCVGVCVLLFFFVLFCFVVLFVCFFLCGGGGVSSAGMASNYIKPLALKGTTCMILHLKKSKMYFAAEITIYDIKDGYEINIIIFNFYLEAHNSTCFVHTLFKHLFLQCCELIKVIVEITSIHL